MVGQTLSTTGPSAHDLGQSGPPSDRPELHRAYHKRRRCCPTRPNNSGTVPDHSIHSQTVRLHRSDHPEHQKSHMMRLVWKAGINIAGHPSSKRRKSHLSLSLFGPLSLNLLFAPTRTRHKRRKLSSHLILLSVIKYLMSYLNMVILNCHI
jgi:hypothetical protein